ncbi:YceI family protein [Roseiconus lacunae]|uniref:YceI family protein n=1 Tax=Roseiconus lacunae TaxID=2605694 RepID=A0ABT7PN49_9BACT|nr:YceI family protein [Roseiconus lacunae]MCD0463311.1 YceI family protein [Roseiconus lacunae]MDM4017939.1 YceI family protein [Roseiconus lacunae]WRQ52486.1 YceI family protein [Stieleria sp. HD01]
MKYFHALLIVGLSFVTAPIGSAAEKMTLDADDSKITFVGSKPDGKHEGGFKKVKGEATADFEDPSASSLAIEIDAQSLWSDNDKLTNHLKSPDFFDVRKHSTIKFESTKVEVTPGENVSKAKITGKWTMLGKTVEVEVPATVKMTEAGLEMTADFEIDRTKWGMTYGKGKIDDKVKVQAKLVLKR